VEKPEEITVKTKAYKDLEEISWEDVDCIDLVHDREKRWAVVHAVMNFGGSLKCGYFLTSRGTIGL
jgi:predicted CoA-binding protein